LTGESALKLGRVVLSLASANIDRQVRDRHGGRCAVWRNPCLREFARAIQVSDHLTCAGLRGLLSDDDFFVWQSDDLPHAEFERQTNLGGTRLALRSGLILVNHETTVFPDCFPYVFRNIAAACQSDIDQRCDEVIFWLRRNERLRAIYPEGFKVEWYS